MALEKDGVSTGPMVEFNALKIDLTGIALKQVNRDHEDKQDFYEKLAEGYKSTRVSPIDKANAAALAAATIEPGKGDGAQSDVASEMTATGAKKSVKKNGSMVLSQLVDHHIKRHERTSIHAGGTNLGTIRTFFSSVIIQAIWRARVGRKRVARERRDRLERFDKRVEKTRRETIMKVHEEKGRKMDA